METENNTTVPGRSKFTHEQKKQILDEYNAGASVPELQIKYNIHSSSTIYMWGKAMEKKRSVKKRKTIRKIQKTVKAKPPQSVNGDLGAENQILRNLIIDMILGKVIK